MKLMPWLGFNLQAMEIQIQTRATNTWTRTLLLDTVKLNLNSRHAGLEFDSNLAKGGLIASLEIDS